MTEPGRICTSKVNNPGRLRTRNNSIQSITLQGSATGEARRVQLLTMPPFRNTGPVHFIHHPGTTRARFVNRGGGPQAGTGLVNSRWQTASECPAPLWMMSRSSFFDAPCRLNPLSPSSAPPIASSRSWDTGFRVQGVGFSRTGLNVDTGPPPAPRSKMVGSSGTIWDNHFIKWKGATNKCFTITSMSLLSIKFCCPFLLNDMMSPD